MLKYILLVSFILTDYTLNVGLYVPKFWGLWGAGVPSRAPPGYGPATLSFTRKISKY